MNRKIDDVLYFRTDQSPFLVHLTRVSGDRSASDCLRAIVDSKKLEAGSSDISDVRFGGNTKKLEDPQKRRFLRSVSFSETPISEVHCLLEIEGRQINLEPYGLAFLKARLEPKGVSPVIYLNNTSGKMDPVASALFQLGGSHPAAAELILPLVSVFGSKLKAPGAKQTPRGCQDWRWEREWRMPAALAPLEFKAEDVFIGFCPHDEIGTFEALFPGVGFIDPRRNMKWYATTLVEQRQRLNLKYSVV